MGQRHQVFVVARVIPHNSTDKRAVYRCVAALHHQWCYGRLPLKALWRFLTLIKHPDNAKVIRQDLQAIQGKYGAYGKKEPTMPDTPCQYIAFLLLSAWNVGLEKAPDAHFSQSSWTLPAHVDTWRAMNDDGLSFIDVTDPCDPAYCMTYYGTEILTAEQYVRIYYEIPTAEEMEIEAIRQTEEDVLKSISLLANERLITLQTLAEAWPHEYGEAYTACLQVEEELEASQPAPSVTTIPSLADLAIGPLIEAVLQSEQTDLLTDVFMLPGKTALIMTELRVRTNVPDSAISLLASVLTYDLKTTKVTDLDLTNFPSWSDTQISRAISLIAEDLLTNVTMVDVSHNPQFSSCDLIEEILTHIPSLKRLDVLDTSIEISSLSLLISTRPELFKRLEVLLHPAFFQIDESVIHRCGFSCVVVTDERYLAYPQRFCTAYLPVWTPVTVVQSLNDFLPALVPLKDEYGRRYSPPIYDLFSALVIQALFSGAPVHHGHSRTWHHRHVSLIPGFSNAGFVGEGWMLVLYCSKQRGDLGWFYGFVKVDAEKVNSAMDDSNLKDLKSEIWKIYDLEDFLEEMGREGRPLPSKAAIETLKQLLTELSTPLLEQITGTEIPCGLMDDATFEEMVKLQPWRVSDELTVKCLLKIGNML